MFLPHLYGHGRVDRFGSSILHGSPFAPPTRLAVLVRFPLGSIVSSHYHDPPVLHEMVYLQGGHLTPDGFYGPGDHVTSIPGCKEGPWLATSDPEGERPSWPTNVGARSGSLEAPWPALFRGRRGHRVHGLLFVHGGPFVNLVGAIHWHRLAVGQLGPQETDA